METNRRSAAGVARQWIAEAQGGRWETLHELAHSFASHRHEFGGDYDDALEVLCTIAKRWGCTRSEIKSALSEAIEVHTGACIKRRRANLVRVVPALRRTSVAANDVSRDWSEAA